jgi:alpha-methylacyl-CoA racemase
VGAIEPQFYRALLDGLGLSAAELPEQLDRSRWPELKARFAGIFATRTRDEWAAVFDGTDACVTPVLAFGEVPGHPGVAARGTVVSRDGVLQAAPAPRFSRTQGAMPGSPADDADVSQILAGWTDEAGLGQDPGPA